MRDVYHDTTIPCAIAAAEGAVGSATSIHALHFRLQSCSIRASDHLIKKEQRLLTYELWPATVFSRTDPRTCSPHKPSKLCRSLRTSPASDVVPRRLRRTRQKKRTLSDLSPLYQASAFAFRSFPLLLRLPLAFAPSGNKRLHHHLRLLCRSIDGWVGESRNVHHSKRENVKA